MENNLTLYNKLRVVPQEAQKQITGGRLNGMTDINPMWRIKTLTEEFGVAGFGWYYEISRMWLERGANDEVSAFVEIELYINQNDEWSKPIKGVGGSTFVAKESRGLYTSDECYKMALTDAISVACKALGFGADVYYSKDRTKYDTVTSNSSDSQVQSEPSNASESPKKELSEKQINRLHAIRKSAEVSEETLKKILMKHYGKSSAESLSRNEYDYICKHLEELISKQKISA